MKLTGPDQYQIYIKNPTEFAIQDSDGNAHFHGEATSKMPKLYVVCHNSKVVYVGITKQAMGARLRFGFKAAGKGGYYGYKWRNHLQQATIHIWYDEKDTAREMKDIEALEAELVYLIRNKYGQWPKYQTEIHFHQSNAFHKQQAKRILSHINHE